MTSQIENPQASLPLVQQALEQSARLSAHSPELLQAEVQLRYLAKVLEGKRPERLRLLRCDLSQLALAESFPAAPSLRALLVTAQRLIEEILRTTAFSPTLRQRHEEHYHSH